MLVHYLHVAIEALENAYDEVDSEQPTRYEDRAAALEKLASVLAEVDSLIVWDK